jgi:hypothetical protein
VEAGLSDQEVAAISGHKSMQMLKRLHPPARGGFGGQARSGGEKDRKFMNYFNGFSYLHSRHNYLI